MHAQNRVVTVNIRLKRDDAPTSPTTKASIFGNKVVGFMPVCGDSVVTVNIRLNRRDAPPACAVTPLGLEMLALHPCTGLSSTRSMF